MAQDAEALFQGIPLPEAQEYQVQLREKEQVGRKKRAERYDLRLKFWEGLVAIARSHNTRYANIKPGSCHWLGASSGIRGLGLNYVIVQECGITELYIDRRGGGGIACAPLRPSGMRPASSGGRLEESR